MRRIIAMAMVLMAVSLSCATALAAGSGTPGGVPLAPPGVIEATAAASAPAMLEEFGVQYVTLYCNEPCDEEWRWKYPSTWVYEVNYCVETADNALAAQFGIDLYSAAQRYWDSNDSTTALIDLLDEAVGEWGLDGCELMLAYTGQNTDIAGAAYQCQPYGIVRWQGHQLDWRVTQQVVSQMFGVPPHWLQGTCKCVMRYCYTDYDNWCSDHGCWKTLYENRNRY